MRSSNQYTWLDRTYALSMWRKIRPKFCLWRKNDKYDVCTSQPIKLTTTILIVCKKVRRQYCTLDLNAMASFGHFGPKQLPGPICYKKLSHNGRHVFSITSATLDRIINIMPVCLNTEQVRFCYWKWDSAADHLMVKLCFLIKLWYVACPSCCLPIHSPS